MKGSYNKKAMVDDVVLGPLAEFEKEYPPLIPRVEVSVITAGLIKPKTIEHDEAKRQGPRKFLMINGKRCYPVRYFLEYLERKGVQVGEIKAFGC
ncbi:hypothetical protein [Maridesulfovibrio ferrireducens]|uniref:hypothetical protein n=1 Tax=Maridesulfovibrio ferrireducens TaxID=246191 RepID=UPI001A325C6C|nr:hypothetical protein [Maridesulfovibrio ferrireducens]MBI9111299.1 hypothetical protein [Maridesulfovibrio ferrireducens]